MMETTLRRLEWPTLALTVGIYIAFGVLTLFAAVLPWWVLLILGGYVTCLHGSLQHEALHGHPTSSAWVNELSVFPAVGLFVPYRRYRTLHLRHHINERLTDPYDDPESFYLTQKQWLSLPWLVRAVMVVNNTLIGRLTIGPAIAVGRFYWQEARAIANGDRQVLTDWLAHIPATALVLLWVIGVCDIALIDYVLLFAYPGFSLILLRSFAEHRAHERTDARTIIVDAGPVFQLLFLNNNLHAAHHAKPALAWYELPKFCRETRDVLDKANSGYTVPGYIALARRYLLKPKEPVAHPILGSRSNE